MAKHSVKRKTSAKAGKTPARKTPRKKPASTKTAKTAKKSAKQ